MVLHPEFLVLMIKTEFKALHYLADCTKKVKAWLVIRDLELKAIVESSRYMLE